MKFNLPAARGTKVTKYLKIILLLVFLICVCVLFTNPRFQVFMGGIAGKRTTPDQKTSAAWWYRKAAEQGYAPGQYFLGLALSQGWGGADKDVKEAETWLRKAAAQGEPGAMGELGSWYAEGKILPQDYQEAAKWYQQAADKGSCTAQYDLGLLYAKGLGVPKNPDEAEKLFTKASRGYHIAHLVGKMYFSGTDLPKDYRKATAWFFQDQLHETESDYYLGCIFLQGGDGVPQDAEKAMRYFQKAAQKGHGQSQYELGLLYQTGKWAKPDAKAAEQWFRKSADLGNASAQAQLERMKSQAPLPEGTGP